MALPECPPGPLGRPLTGIAPAILVVEDEVLIRFTIADHLRAAGFQVLEAANAEEAMALLLKGNTSVQLVFTDINMPGGRDGLALAQWIHERMSGLKVIITSGMPVSPLAFQQLGKVPFLPKPYDLDDVTRRVRLLTALPPGSVWPE